MTSKLVKLMRDAEQRQWDWETIMDEAADRIAELEGALRDIAEGGFANEAAIRYRARAALRSETP
jgi:asparagine synthetase A